MFEKKKGRIFILLFQKLEGKWKDLLIYMYEKFFTEVQMFKEGLYVSNRLGTRVRNGLK